MVINEEILQNKIVASIWNEKDYLFNLDKKDRKYLIMCFKYYQELATGEGVA